MNVALRGLMRSVGLSVNGNPTVRCVKNLRNGLVDASFRRRRGRVGRDFADGLLHRGIREATFTIAFNAPWTIDLLTHQWSRNHPGLQLVVVDNSSDPAARSAHSRICGERGIPYLPLPWNPEWSPNRSHGIALNWVWFNVVLHADLDVAGFIDHDCIPVATIDLKERLARFSAYGLRGASLTHPEAWNLWAGYCFLRPADTVKHAIDFKHRIEYGLDTGGGNWHGFYRHLEPSTVGEAVHRRERIPLGRERPPMELLLLDEAFLHLDGGSYREALRDESTRRLLVEAIRSCG